MSVDSKQQGMRRPYEAPKLTAISLRPEEAVLGHCKISGTTGPSTNSCAAIFCMSLGS